MSSALLNSDIYNKQQCAMLDENFTTLCSLWFWTCSMPLRVLQIHCTWFLFSAAINMFYLTRAFLVGELFVFVGKQSDPALCLCYGGSLFSKGDCRGCEKEKYGDYLQFCTLRLLSLFGELFLWKILKFYAEMQHTSRNFKQLLNCLRTSSLFSDSDPLDGLNGPFTCFLRAVFQNSEVLFVFVFNAVFQDAQNYQSCSFCMPFT